jgi:serine/threonine protein kinase
MFVAGLLRRGNAKHGKYWFLVASKTNITSGTDQTHHSLFLRQVQHLHCKGILHTDIKPDNWLLQDGIAWCDEEVFPVSPIIPSFPDNS